MAYYFTEMYLKGIYIYPFHFKINYQWTKVVTEISPMRPIPSTYKLTRSMELCRSIHGIVTTYLNSNTFVDFLSCQCHKFLTVPLANFVGKFGNLSLTITKSTELQKNNLNKFSRFLLFLFLLPWNNIQLQWIWRYIFLQFWRLNGGWKLNDNK